MSLGRPQPPPPRSGPLALLRTPRGLLTTVVLFCLFYSLFRVASPPSPRHFRPVSAEGGDFPSRGKGLGFGWRPFDSPDPQAQDGVNAGPAAVVAEPVDPPSDPERPPADDVGHEDHDEPAPARESEPDEKPTPEETAESAVSPSIKLDDDQSEVPGEKEPAEPGLSTTIVVGRLDRDAAEVGWIHRALDQDNITHKAIYIVDDPEAPLALKQNKGRESMVYLKYIVDHYDTLDDVTLFFHASRDAWHNNLLHHADAALMINNLNRQHVLDVGYFPARCEQYPGCGEWITFNPDKETHRKHPERFGDLFSNDLWDQIFPERVPKYPQHLGEPCCSQFAVSRDQIRKIPLDQYILIHDWLGTTGTLDGYTGRVMEYVWQYLFLEKEQYCPSVQDCYCKGYGLCVDDASGLEDYTRSQYEEDQIATDLSNWDKEHCEALKDGDVLSKCKNENPWRGKNDRATGKRMHIEGILREKYAVKAQEH